MYILPVTNSSYSPNFSGGAKSKNIFNRALEKIIDAVPDTELKDNPSKREIKRKIDETLSKPAQNRLIMGITALLTQPWIDYFNHRVDEDTRKVARNRTIAKIIAGTAVGMVVRGSCYKLVEKMTDIGGKGKNSMRLVPKKYLGEFIHDAHKLKNYRNALSTIVAITAMCFTNFLIDAPLTRYLTNKFNAKTEAKKSMNQKAEEVLYA